MFVFKWPLAITSLLLCLFIHTTALAQSLKAQQNALALSEKQLEALNAQRLQLQTDLNAANMQVQDEQGITAKKNLAAAKKLLDQATANYEKEPTAENKAKQSNAAFKYALAERKFKKANDNQELQQKSAALAKQLAATEKEMSALANTIDQQKKAIANKKHELKNKNNVLKEQQRLQKQREAEAEIKRLKAELARQKLLQIQREANVKQHTQARQQAQSKTPPRAKQQAQSKAPTQDKQQAQNKKPTQDKQQAQNKAQPQAKQHVQSKAPAQAKQQARGALQAEAGAAPAAQSEPAANKTATAAVAATQSGAATTGMGTGQKPVIKASQTGSVTLLTTKRQVRKENRRITKLLSRSGKKRSRYDKVLNIKPILATGTLGTTIVGTLRSLGRDQYKAEVLLTPGEVLLEVESHRWIQNIPAQPEGTDYVFIYNIADSNNPRLVYFEKKLSRR